MVALLAFALSAIFELNENFSHWSRAYEHWEVDELPVLFFALSLACTWYAYRRMRELQTEVTAHHQTAAVLQESERRYRALVEGSVQGMWLQKGVVIHFTNHALAEIFGYDSPEALMHQEVWQLVAPQERSRLEGCGLAGPRDERAPSRQRWQGRRQDGTLIWIESLVSSLTWNAEPARLVTVLDVTERLRQEQEQQRIAYEIHDGIAQLLVSAQQHLETFEDLWRRQDPRAEPQLARGMDNLHQAIVEARRLMARLRPVLLETLGLVPAVRQYLFEELRPETGWEVEFLDEVGNLDLPPDWETAVFRIIQEALTNARKHAGTHRVSVVLRREGEQCELFSVVIKDWGKGFEPAQVPSGAQHLGLLVMRERARMLGGTCTIESHPRHGTTVVMRLPLSPGGAA